MGLVARMGDMAIFGAENRFATKQSLGDLWPNGLVKRNAPLGGMGPGAPDALVESVKVKARLREFPLRRESENCRRRRFDQSCEPGNFVLGGPRIAPAATNWYSQATPELLALAAERLQRAEGRS